MAAFFVGLMVCLGFFWFLGIPAQVFTSGGELFRYLAMSTHFDQSLNAGSLNWADLVYFASLIAFGLFTGTIAVESRRWR
jgi:hypothetical protein